MTGKSESKPMPSAIMFDRAGLERAGFAGLVTVAALSRPGAFQSLPRDPGVYVLVRDAVAGPAFIDPGTGGWFKDTDPNVRVAVLEANWIADASVVYIGMASSLRTRVGQLIKFGQGKNIGHKGGRYLWQLAGSGDLIVAWQICAEPRDRESELLRAFVDRYGAFPYANLQW